MVVLLLLTCSCAATDVKVGGATCTSDLGGHAEDSVRSSSLLQVNGLPRQGSQAFAKETFPAAAYSDADLALLQERDSTPEIALSSVAEHSGGASRVGELMERAAEETQSAEMSMAARATKSAQAAQAFEEVRRSSEEARAAQEMEARRIDDVGEVLAGALRKVQGAAEVEQQELSMKALATRRLQDAAKGAREVQQLEDESAEREAQAADMLQEVMHKLQSSDRTDRAGGQAEVDALKAVEEAERLVAAQSSDKVRASQLLQSSLEGAAAAVEDLKHGKEAQTATWLREASADLRTTHSALRRVAQAEANVAERITATATASESARALAADTSASEEAASAKMHDIAQQVRSAQDAASQQSAQDAIQEAHDAEDAMRKSTAQSQAAMNSRLAELSSEVQNARASSEAQKMQFSQLLQQFQIEQAQVRQPQISPQQVVGAAGFGQPATIMQAPVATSMIQAPGTSPIMQAPQATPIMQVPAAMQTGSQFGPAGNNYLQAPAVAPALGNPGNIVLQPVLAAR